MSNKGVNSRRTSQSSVILFALITFRNVTACNLWVIETAGIEPAYPVVVSTRCTAIRLQNN
ncbi:TPA: hypothetical protein ACQOJ5_001912, partial [Streptococcus pyogenes]